MWHVLTRSTKFVVVDSSTYVSVNLIYFNGINFTSVVIYSPKFAGRD